MTGRHEFFLRLLAIILVPTIVLNAEAVGLIGMSNRTPQSSAFADPPSLFMAEALMLPMADVGRTGRTAKLFTNRIWRSSRKKPVKPLNTQDIQRHIVLLLA